MILWKYPTLITLSVSCVSPLQTWRSERRSGPRVHSQKSPGKMQWFVCNKTWDVLIYACMFFCVYLKYLGWWEKKINHIYHINSICFTYLLKDHQRKVCRSYFFQDRRILCYNNLKFCTLVEIQLVIVVRGCCSKIQICETLAIL